MLSRGSSRISREPDVYSKPRSSDTSSRAIAARGRCRSGPSSFAALEVRPFTDKQIALLKTFADQAVIAIENVRLFQELQERTRELVESVEEMKALGEVGQAVSSTLDLETVLETIVARAVDLSGTDCGVIYEYDEAAQEFNLRASHHMEAEAVEGLRAARIRAGRRRGGTGGADSRAGADRGYFAISRSVRLRGSGRCSAGWVTAHY